MGLPDEAQRFLGKWGEIQFTAFSKKLKPGDVKMMKQLAERCHKKGQIAYSPPARLPFPPSPGAALDLWLARRSHYCWGSMHLRG